MLNHVQSILDVNHLSFEYAEQLLLHDVHFSLFSGDILHVKGQNGAGKTTLLKLLAGLLHPTVGEICYQGLSIQKQHEHYRQSMCYVGHKSGVHALLTPREHWYLALPHVTSNVSFEDAMETLGLSKISDVACYLLSAGQRRRVALLRLLTSDASLWLLDEPWVALDKQASLMLQRMLERHVHSQGMVVLTSHQAMPFDEMYYRVYEL
jgi:heme exporter protein A